MRDLLTTWLPIAVYGVGAFLVGYLVGRRHEREGRQ
jgi:hypothetical protein